MKHPHQIAVIKSDKRFQFILAGRRGGKTRLMLEMLLHRAHTAPFASTVFYVGPTLQHAYDLIWEDLVERLDELGWSYKALVSKRCIYLSRRRRIMVIGAEKIRRIRGSKAWHVFFDELAFFTADLNHIWKKSARPALSDLKGKATMATTPDGKGSAAYKFYEDLRANTKSWEQDWEYFHWRTIDNPYIDPMEVEAAKRELDEPSFNQEYLAEWQSFVGLAYYNFKQDVHVKPQEIYKELPLNLSFDFNVNPTTLLIDQMHHGIIRFKKEYSLKNSSTIETVKRFCSDFTDYPVRTIGIYGDASGKARESTTGRSDYEYILEILQAAGFQPIYNVLASNPPIIDRVQHVNSWLLNYHGQHRIEIDPSCRELILDLSSQELDGRIPSDKNNMGHKADALGYRVNFEHLTQKRGTTRTIQL